MDGGRVGPPGRVRRRARRGLLVLVAMTGTLLITAQPAWASFTDGPSVRVTPNSKVEIRWTANFVGNGRVEIFDNPNGGTPIDANTSSLATNSHTINFLVCGSCLLTPDTTYYFRIVHKDPTNSLLDLTNDPAPYPPFFTGTQAISDVAVTAGTDSAVVSWDANVIGYGQAEYGETTSYGRTVDDGNNATDHSLYLTGLQPSTTYYFRVSNRHAIDGDSLAEETGSFTTPAGFAAEVQPPINADGSSTFNANRGVVPLRFTLTEDGNQTCDLPPATLRLTRTGGTSPGSIDESVYSGPSDNGSDFRITNCAYHYNAYARALGPGAYLAEILIDGAVVGEARFELK